MNHFFLKKTAFERLNEALAGFQNKFYLSVKMRKKNAFKPFNTQPFSS